jgi:hypothetical protein
MTMRGKLTFKRMALSPYKKNDKEILEQLTGKRRVFPLDEVLHINDLPYKLTVNVILDIAYWVQHSRSYEGALQAIQRNTSIEVNDETIRSVANTIGAIVFDRDTREADRVRELYDQGKLTFPDLKFDHILYLEVDGAMLHTRDIDNNCSPYRENKLGLAFSTDNLTFYTNKKGERCHRLGKREYIAYLGDAETFIKYMFALAIRNGYGKYKTTIILSDGATWIRNMKQNWFPDAQQILDYFHLCENVSKYAKDIFSLDENKYRPWTTTVCTLLKESKYKEAIDIIKTSKKPPKGKKTVDLLGYLENNIDNIDYAYYLSQNWFIGSGAIESANRSVLQQRLKQPGMRWNPDCGQYILTLMSKAKSGIWTREVVDPIRQFYK